MSTNAQQRRISVAVPFEYTEGDKLRPCQVEVELDEPWLAVLTLEAQNGTPVIVGVEVRIRPADRKRDVVRSTIRPPHAPQGGLTAAVLRSVAFTQALIVARASLREVSGETLTWHGFSKSALRTANRPGKRGAPDRYYAEIAAAYVKAIDKDGPRGARVRVAESMSRNGGSFDSAFVRDALGTARRRGLLTKARQGAAEGQLTEKGKAALRKQSIEKAATAGAGSAKQTAPPLS